MNKKIKLWVSTVLITLIGFAIISCDMPTGDNGKKAPLNKPTIWINGENFTLQWAPVEGAVSYSVDIGGSGENITVTDTEYSLKALTLDPKLYTLRVRANAASNDKTYSNSAYSTALTCEVAEYIFEFDNDGPSANAKLAGKNIVQFSEGGRTITGLTNFGQQLDIIVIPASIGGIDITGIGENAFTVTVMISIVIPETIAEIGSNAFSGASELATITFEGTTVPEMAPDAFAGADSLKTINVPTEIKDEFEDWIQNVAENFPENAILKEITISSIEVTIPPTNTIYLIGETLNTTGILVTATRSDGEKVTVPESELLFSLTSFTTAGNFSITVSYQGRSASFNVTVNPVLESIEVTKKPTKISYTIGDTLNTAGMEVTAYFCDGSSRVIPLSQLSLSPTKLNTVGLAEITVTYQGKTAVFDVLVSPAGGNTDPALNGTWLGTGYSGWGDSVVIPCDNHPDCGGLWPNPSVPLCTDCQLIEDSGYEEFDIKLVVTNRNYNIYMDDIYGEKGTFTTSNNTIIMTPIEILTYEFSPTKAGIWYTRALLKAALIASGETEQDAERFVSERFNPSVMSFLVSGNMLELTGNEGTVILHKEGTTPQVIITGIEVTTSPAKTVYIVGETLDTTGIEVTATLSDNSKQIIEPALLSFNPTTLNSAGTITITVSNQGRNTSFNVTVNPAGGGISFITPLTSNEVWEIWETDDGGVGEQRITGSMAFTKVQQRDTTGAMVLMDITAFVPDSAINIKTGVLSLKLGTPLTQALHPASSIYNGFTSTNGLNLLIADMVISVNEENETEHGLIWGKIDLENMEEWRQIVFIYADRPGTISGTKTHADSDYAYAQLINMNLQQGWNTIIMSNYFDDEMGLYTESLVTGSPDGFTWYVTEIFSDEADDGGGPGGTIVPCPDCGMPMPCECHP